MMLMMVVTTLMPTWAFGTEAAPAAQSGTQSEQAAAAKTGGARPSQYWQSSLSRRIQYAAGDHLQSR